MGRSNIDFCKHTDLFNEVEKHVKDADEPENKRLCTRFDFAMDYNNVRARRRGDLLMEEFERLLSDFDAGSFARSARQKEWHKAIMSVLTHIFYGDDLENNIEKLCRKFDLEYLCAFLRIVAARRQGKTVAINQTIVTLLRSGLPIEIVMFSTGRRLSSENLNGIYRFLIMVEPEIQDRIAKKNEEHLWVWNEDGTLMTKLACVPSSVEISTFILFCMYLI